uniref:Uncharacterized protein n=1 Tax=Sinocyclocheilus rhinocerous TaxID=307959 RepID=A0A673G7W4_9TELE
MSGFLRGIARVRAAPVLRGSAITQRANITTRPAKDKFGPVVSICRALVVSSAAREGSSAHLERIPLTEQSVTWHHYIINILLKSIKF